MKTHCSKACGKKKTTNCMAKIKTCVATTVIYLSVGMVLQFFPELYDYSHWICIV